MHQHSLFQIMHKSSFKHLSLQYLFKYLQIVYDINPFVLAILEVYLHSHWEFSPASPGQVKWRFSANKG